MCNTVRNVLAVAYIKCYFYVDVSGLLDFSSMFCRAVSWHLNFFMIIQHWLQFCNLYWQEQVQFSNITDCNGSYYYCCSCLCFFPQNHWKTSLQNALFKRNHSPFLLTSFVFFFPVFSDAFTFLSTHLSSNFSYLHLFAMGNFSSCHQGKALFFFPFFSVLSLLYLTMHNKEIQKEVFFRTPNVYMAITTFLKIKSSSWVYGGRKSCTIALKWEISIVSFLAL